MLLSAATEVLRRRALNDCTTRLRILIRPLLSSLISPKRIYTNRGIARHKLRTLGWVRYIRRRSDTGRNLATGEEYGRTGQGTGAIGIRWRGPPSRRPGRRTRIDRHGGGAGSPPHRRLGIYQQAVSPLLFQGLYRDGQHHAGRSGMVVRLSRQTMEERAAPSGVRQTQYETLREAATAGTTGCCRLHPLPTRRNHFLAQGQGANKHAPGHRRYGFRRPCDVARASFRALFRRLGRNTRASAATRHRS